MCTRVPKGPWPWRIVPLHQLFGPGVSSCSSILSVTRRCFWVGSVLLMSAGALVQWLPPRFINARSCISVAVLAINLGAGVARDVALAWSDNPFRARALCRGFPQWRSVLDDSLKPRSHGKLAMTRNHERADAFAISQMASLSDVFRLPCFYGRAGRHGPLRLWSRDRRPRLMDGLIPASLDHHSLPRSRFCVPAHLFHCGGVLFATGVASASHQRAPRTGMSMIPSEILPCVTFNDEQGRWKARSNRHGLWRAAKLLPRPLTSCPLWRNAHRARLRTLFGFGFRWQRGSSQGKFTA